MTASASDLKAQGNAAFQSGDFSKAIELFSNAIALDASNHVLFSNRSACYSSLKQYKEALQDAEKTVELKPDWPKGYSRKGAALYGLEELQDAVSVYEKGLSLDPENALLKKGLQDVQAAMAAPKNPFAKLFGPDVFEKIAANPQISHYMADQEVVQKVKMLQQNPQLVNGMMQDQKMMQLIISLLGISANVGTPEDMPAPEPATSSAPPPPEPKKEPEPEPISEEEAAKKAKRAGSDEEKALGNQEYKKRNFEAALVHYDKAFELDDSNIAVLTNKSAVLFEMAKFEECIEICKKAVELGREIFADFKIIARAFSRMGTAYAKLKDFTNAVVFMEKSLTEFRNPEVLEKLRLYEKQKKEAEIESYHDPVLSEEARERGNTLFKQNQYADAVKEYSEAIKRNRKDPKNYSNRAACYTKLMALYEADKDCDEAIKLDENFLKAYIRKAAIQFAKKDYKKCMDICSDALNRDTEKKHTAEIQNQMYRCQSAMNVRDNSDSSREETLKRAMDDPEVQEILSDPVMRSILEQMQQDPKAAQDHLKNPMIYKKLQVLMNAGVIQMR